ncbi:spermidine synthase [Pseudonocardia sp. CA-107938]|uniref:spermidine synthase n=1 Tax=Pseudonocardia sp. CA-107938 TaxID=3240021 RepID=UPI003D918D08
MEIERVQGVNGELVLRSRGTDHEIVANGVFLMDTSDGRSERLLVTAATERIPARGRMLLGGLGVGFSLAAALAEPRVREVHVVEVEPAVVRWNRGPLAARHGDALTDPRVQVHVADVADVLAGAAAAEYDAVCLDVDNGPDWVVVPENARLYAPPGIAAALRVLAPGGVLAVWSATRVDALAAQLRERLDDVRVLEVPVARGEPDVVVLGTVRG